MQIDFHDTGRGPRVPSMTDHFGFTMASLSENGSVFANPCKGEKHLSTLMYRPFCSWANNSEVSEWGNSCISFLQFMFTCLCNISCGCDVKF